MDLSDILKGILYLGVASFIVIFMLLMFEQFADDTKVSTTITDENRTVTSGQATTLNDEVDTLDGCYSGINKTVLTTGECNLTNGELGAIRVSTNVGTTIVTLNYTYQKNSGATDVVDTAIDGYDSISDWYPIMILMVIFIALLAAVLLVMRYRSVRR